MKVDLKLYRGYVNENHLVVFGHVFNSWAPDKYRVDRKGFAHAYSVIRMFFIKPLKNVEVTLSFKGFEITTKTLRDGYFRFDIPFDNDLPGGWHNYTVTCRLEGVDMTSNGELLKPHPGNLGIISDIDDTFLVSHSDNIFRKLYVMLYRNVNDRKVFADVVQHYQQLSRAGQQKSDAGNAFFYVSSSEWNLYELIDDFAEINKLPKAVIKLKDIKNGIADFLFSGRGNHHHKFYKIKDIISFYPHLQYVLLGDDSQRDPWIYEHIVKIFPGRIRAVYIRQTDRRDKHKVEKVLANLETLGVATCYFTSSDKAIAHSKQIGII